MWLLFHEIDSAEIGTGAFTVEVRHGVSRDDTVFTVGLSTGVGAIEYQTIKNVYAPGDQILVIGKTANSVILTVKINDPNGLLFREFDIFSDRIGTFKIDDFRIPSNGLLGEWSIKIGSEGNFVKEVFTVETSSDIIQIKLDRENGDYNWIDENGDLVAESDGEFYEYYYGDLISQYNEEEVDKLGFQYEASVVIGVDYYLYEKKYWVHGWASIMPYSKGLTDHSFVYEKGDIDFDLGLVAGYKFNRNIGIFGEGRYLKYFGINAYELKAGINVTIF